MTNVSQSDSTRPLKRERPNKFRHHVITTFVTKNFLVWALLDLADVGIRYASFQLELSPSGRLHLQAYFEFYDALRISQVKARLNDNTLHSEKRKGTREQARDYTMKDDSPWYETNYPEWNEHGGRIPGTTPVTLGAFRSKQGQRTDMDQVTDLIKDGASELDLFESCPSQYLKYSTGIRRARALYARKRCNKYKPIDVHVIYGPTRSGKTRFVYDRHGPQNVYIPTYSASANKFWFDGYDGQKVLLINEFYGQARTSVMQELLDHYRIQVETKGGTTVSNWDHIYITSNCHPDDWYTGWSTIPDAVRDSFCERIKTVTQLKNKKGKITKTWSDCPSLIKTKSGGAPSITPTTYVPRTPISTVQKTPVLGEGAPTLDEDLCTSMQTLTAIPDTRYTIIPGRGRVACYAPEGHVNQLG